MFRIVIPFQVYDWPVFILSHSVGSLFTLLKVSFDGQAFLMLTKSNVTFCCCCCCCWYEAQALCETQARAAYPGAVEGTP